MALFSSWLLYYLSLYPLCSLVHLPVCCHPPLRCELPEGGTSIMAVWAQSRCPQIFVCGTIYGPRTNIQALSSHRPDSSPFLILNVLCDLEQTPQPHSSYRGESRARHKVRISKYVLLDSVRFKLVLTISFYYCQYSASYLRTEKMWLCPFSW